MLGAGLFQVDRSAFGAALGGDRGKAYRAYALGQAKMQMAVATGHARAPIFVRGARPVCDSSGPIQDFDRAQDRFRIGVSLPGASKRFGIAGKALKRRSETRLQPDRHLSLNKLVGEIDHGALIDLALEGYAHVPGNNVRDARKTELAHERRSCFGVIRTPLGDVVDQRCRSHQMYVKRHACFVQLAGEARCEPSNRAAMTPDGFGRRGHIEYGFAFLRIGHVMVCQCRHKPAVVVGAVHVHQASPVEDGNAGRFALVPGEDSPQSAFPIALKDFAEKCAADERRMPPLATKNWVYDGGARRRSFIQHAADRGGTDQWHVHWQKDETFDSGRQRRNARLHAREHSFSIVGVVYGRDIGSG